MSVSPHRIPLAAALLALQFPLPQAAASEPPGLPHAAGGTVLPAITVSGAREAQRARKDAPIQALVIGEEDVERFGDATVGDVLRRLPGMGFSGPAGVVKDIRMRGLDKGYTQFLINGEPVPTATKDRQFQVDRLSADMIERIEIVRGPSAMLDAGGVGGTINIVLKQRADDLTRLRAAAGRNGRLDVGDVVGQWSRRLGVVDAVLALSHTVGAEDVIEEKDGFSAAGALTQREHKDKPAKKTETLFSPRLSWRHGDDRLSLDGFVTLGSEDKTETSNIANAAGAHTKGVVKKDDKDDTIWRLGARYDARAAWGEWHAKAGVLRARIDKTADATETNAAGALTKTTDEWEDIADGSRYAAAGLSLPLGEANRLSAGLEWRTAEFDHIKRKTENGTDRSAPADRFNIAERRGIAYLQHEWEPAAGHLLTPGLRAEQVRRKAADANGIVNQGRSTSTHPSLHYRWALRKNTLLRAAATRTLKLPKFDQLNPLLTTRSGTLSDPDTAGNTALRPERARGYELGIEHYVAGLRGVLGANLYRRDVQDFIQKHTELEGERYVQRPRNVAQARFHGLELDWRLPLAHKGPHTLTLSGSHAELRGHTRLAGSGERGGVKDMPPRITTLGLDWTHQPSRWSVGASASHQPGFTTDSRNDDGVRDVRTRNASTLLDAYVTKVFSPQAELRLVAKNLLAVKKRERTEKYNAAGSFTGTEAKVEHSEPTVFVSFGSRF